MTDLLAQLGMTKEELADRVVQQAVRELLHDGAGDGYDGPAPSRFAEQLQKQIRRSIDRGVRAIGDRVSPEVERLIEATELRETNRWGEPKGERQTFREYLVAHAQRYYTEQVDREGQAKNEVRYPSDWRAHTTRAVYLIDRHLRSTIDGVLEQVVAEASKLFAGGLEAGVKQSLEELLQRLKVETKV